MRVKYAVALLIIWGAGMFAPVSSADPNSAGTMQPIESRDDEESRLRLSILTQRLSTSGKSLFGSGPQASLERSLGGDFVASASAGRSYGLEKNPSLLCSTFDVGVWYSLVAEFPRVKRSWTLGGSSIMEFSQNPRGNLRLGISAQRFVFPVRNKNLAFDGAAAKILYDILPADPLIISIGAEIAQLKSSTHTLISMGALISASRRM